MEPGSLFEKISWSRPGHSLHHSSTLIAFIRELWSPAPSWKRRRNSLFWWNWSRFGGCSRVFWPSWSTLSAKCQSSRIYARSYWRWRHSQSWWSGLERHMVGISGIYPDEGRNRFDKESSLARRGTRPKTRDHLWVVIEVVSYPFWLVKDATSILYQLKIVVQRNNTAIWRSPEYIFSRLFVTSFISFFISLSFLQLGHSVRDLQFRVFAMCVHSAPWLKYSLNMIARFWVVVLPAIVMSQIEPLFILNRSEFLSRIVFKLINSLARGFLSGYVFH